MQLHDYYRIFIYISNISNAYYHVLSVFYKFLRSQYASIKDNFVKFARFNSHQTHFLENFEFSLFRTSIMMRFMRRFKSDTS